MLVIYLWCHCLYSPGYLVWYSFIIYIIHAPGIYRLVVICDDTLCLFRSLNTEWGAYPSIYSICC